ncbi:MAG: QacE family quaternary ammonium compound efflux SMR transporter [Candidatus Methanomethylophilaceae archaeon]|nr:QacE family quaternary ammonium compound efflux SMR transporter [Candidatus Methanomethylophilaceae archaeon]
MNFENNKKLGWLIIIMGGIFQVGWSVGLDYTDGMTNILWDIIVLVSLLLSMLCLSIPMKTGINMSTAYAVWVGLGVMLTIIVSAVLGRETVTIGMVIFMMVILAGVVGLKLES